MLKNLVSSVWNPDNGKEKGSPIAAGRELPRATLYRYVGPDGKLLLI
jgi:hypothetical protein